MKEYILIVGGGWLQVPVIETAYHMGFKTIVMDMDHRSPGIFEAHVPLLISTRDIALAVRAAKIQNKITPIQGVLTVGTDASTTVAAIAKELGLPGVNPEVAFKATNKGAMRKALLQHNVPAPKVYSSIGDYDIFDQAMKGSIKFPLVVKPIDNMGARGVSKVYDSTQLLEAYHIAKKYSTKNEVIVEEYMEGPEFSIDAIVYNSEITITGIADRIIAPSPHYFVEMGHTMPSHAPKEQQDAAIEVFKQGIKALGIDHGCAKGDIKYTPKGAMVGEIAARLSGGFMSTHTYPLSTGVDLMKAAVRLAIGEHPGDLEPYFNKVAIERSLVADKEGILKEAGIEYGGIPMGKNEERIKEIHFSKEVGNWVAPPKNNVERLGHLIAVGNTLEQAEKAIEYSKKYIKIRIED